jgi:hypothetical protein
VFPQSAINPTIGNQLKRLFNMNDSNPMGENKLDISPRKQFILDLNLVATRAILAARRKRKPKDKKPAVQADPGNQQVNKA